MLTLATSTSAGPWRTVIVVAIIIAFLVFPFIACEVVDRIVRGLNHVFASEDTEFDNVNAGIAAGFIAVFVELFALFILFVLHGHRGR